MSPTGAPRRRTQQQRREETIGKLLDAATEAVYELGYAHTTVQEICDRAGLSQGALFRHFPTRKAVLVATAQRVAEAHIEDFTKRFAGVEPSEASLLDALRTLRSLVRAPSNQVWHELVRAARTDPELADEIRPVLREFHRRTGTTAYDVFGPMFPDLERFRAALRITINYLDGETAVAAVSPDPKRDDQTLEMLASLWVSLAGEPPATD